MVSVEVVWDTAMRQLLFPRQGGINHLRPAKRLKSTSTQQYDDPLPCGTYGNQVENLGFHCNLAVSGQLIHFFSNLLSEEACQKGYLVHIQCLLP